MYRDAVRHGGILCTFRKNWQDMQVKTVQHGRGEHGPKSRVTGELVCGPEPLPEHELAANRADMWGDLLFHRFDDAYFRGRSAIVADISVPLLSAGNWGGQGLHLRGNVEGYVGAASKQKWLEMHGGEHWTAFYTDYGVSLQKRFFGLPPMGKGEAAPPPRSRSVVAALTDGSNHWAGISIARS